MTAPHVVDLTATDTGTPTCLTMPANTKNRMALEKMFDEKWSWLQNPAPTADEISKLRYNEYFYSLVQSMEQSLAGWHNRDLSEDEIEDALYEYLLHHPSSVDEERTTSFFDSLIGGANHATRTDIDIPSPSVFLPIHDNDRTMMVDLTADEHAPHTATSLRQSRQATKLPPTRQPIDGAMMSDVHPPHSIRLAVGDAPQPVRSLPMPERAPALGSAAALCSKFDSHGRRHPRNLLELFPQCDCDLQRILSFLSSHDRLSMARTGRAAWSAFKTLTKHGLKQCFHSSRGIFIFEAGVCPSLAPAARSSPYIPRLCRIMDGRRSLNDSYFIIWANKPRFVDHDVVEDILYHHKQLSYLLTHHPSPGTSELRPLLPAYVHSMARLAAHIHKDTILIRLLQPFKQFRFDNGLKLYSLKSFDVFQLREVVYAQVMQGKLNSPSSTFSRSISTSPASAAASSSSTTQTDLKALIPCMMRYAAGKCTLSSCPYCHDDDAVEELRRLRPSVLHWYRMRSIPPVIEPPPPNASSDGDLPSHVLAAYQGLLDRCVIAPPQHSVLVNFSPSLTMPTRPAVAIRDDRSIGVPSFQLLPFDRLHVKQAGEVFERYCIIARRRRVQWLTCPMEVSMLRGSNEWRVADARHVWQKLVVLLDLNDSMLDSEERKQLPADLNNLVFINRSMNGPAILHFATDSSASSIVARIRMRWPSMGNDMHIMGRPAAPREAIPPPLKLALLLSAEQPTASASKPYATRGETYMPRSASELGEQTSRRREWDRARASGSDGWRGYARDREDAISRSSSDGRESSRLGGRSRDTSPSHSSRHRPPRSSRRSSPSPTRSSSRAAPSSHPAPCASSIASRLQLIWEGSRGYPRSRPRSRSRPPPSYHNPYSSSSRHWESDRHRSRDRDRDRDRSRDRDRDTDRRTRTR